MSVVAHPGKTGEPEIGRLRTLYRLLASLSRASALQDVYDAALSALLSATSADRAAILLFDDDGVMRFQTARGLSSEYQAAVTGHSPWARGERDAQPLAVPDVMQDPSLAGFRPLMQREGIRALVFVPLATSPPFLRRRVCWEDLMIRAAHGVFETVIRLAMRQLRPMDGVPGMRAYGEMVGILWKARQFAAAIRLEQLWNKLLEQSSFSLYCAYAIDVFGKEFEVANLHDVLCAHTHLVPSQPDGRLELALDRSMDEIPGEKAASLRVLIKANSRPGWAVIPTAENIVLWLRKNLPKQADQIVDRARFHYDLSLQASSSGG